MTPTIDAVIFDMDGLMFNTEPLSLSTWQDAANAFGYSLSYDFLTTLIGKTIRDVRPLIFAETDSSLPLDDILKLKLELTFKQIRANGVPLKPGLNQLLDWLDAQQISKAVATSTEHRRASFLLTQSNMRPRFDTVVCGSDVSLGKPAPDIFLLTAQRLKVQPHRCLVLEDSASGIQAAHHAGMVTVLIPDLKPPTAETVALTHYQLTSLYEVQAIFNG